MRPRSRAARASEAADLVSLAFDSWSLALDASAVIGLRALTLASGGPAASAEARRMIEEKVGAAMDLQWLAITGGLGPTVHDAASRTVRHYTRRIRSNRRRLTRTSRGS